MLLPAANTFAKWLMLAVGFSALVKADPESMPVIHPQREQTSHGAVASESRECSEVGISLLKHGGSAADAVVGTVLCVGVIGKSTASLAKPITASVSVTKPITDHDLGMYHSGIGGGGFALVRSSDAQYDFINFREVAPAASTQDMFKDKSSTLGGLASGVPGELRGLEHLHQKYGKLPWKVLFDGAVNIARNGFNVNKDLVSRIEMTTPSNDFLSKDPAWAVDFAPDGNLIKLGDRMTRKRYANTLEKIGAEGADAFYAGDIAQSTINAIKNTGGVMTLEDLQNYTVATPAPLEIGYRGYKLHSIPVPASGAIVLSALKTLEGYEAVTPETFDLTVHRLDEALRFAFGARANAGDPNFVPGITDFEANLLSDAHAAEARSKISDARTLNVSEYDPKGLATVDTPGTSEVTAVDATGMAVSFTTTINLLFGAQVIVPETGVILNNQMDDFGSPGAVNSFGYAASPSNYILPGKRPQSSISCTIVDRPDGSLFLSLGAAGGSRIITSNAQNIWHMIDRNLTAAEALAQPRFHDQLTPNTIAFEYAYNNETTKDRGHNVTWVEPGLSIAQAIRVAPNGTFEAAAEPRLANSCGDAY